MLQSISWRQVNFGIALITTASLCFAFYLEHQLELLPCPLCMTQRAFVLLVGLLGLIAAIHNPRNWGNRVYGGLSTIAAVAGGAVAGRHVWLQHLPPEEVPACGPSLEYMLDTLPFSETLSIVLMGDGNCAETLWTLMGFSIPELTLMLFVAFTAVGLWQALRPQAQSNA